MCSILRLKSKSKKAKSANKITTNKRETKKAKKAKIKARKIKIKAKTIETNIKANAKANAKATTTIATITIDKKCLLKLRKQFVCIYINFIFKTTLILLSCLLLFNNLQKY